MKKYFGILLLAFSFAACTSSSNEETATETLPVELQAEETVQPAPALGVWKGVTPLASSNEKGETEQEFSLTLKEENKCDLLGLKEDRKDVPYTFENGKIFVEEFVFEYADGKLYLLNEEGKRFEMENCYILELAPAATAEK
ncbi:hypothetical protein [Porphyromonas circumdentaria]|uniref:NlpE N-terminal domain-containing protein n=1 Tax=Porphyromonas circumdentaria TaxID=29524 RepID=A0A1T4MI03_9PORP|nr:hypothetical protein [Porphyromonas circumdentaria]MBB6275744.1 hypothetical protein [Porphyromonas circumdentaria]MDO4721750.1 hypothetical protein [Porphyromonas circumdentaria]SJZ66582.1 hypothetical protein SAMN02745171_00785 [Porphyromonas circumdentaria]